MKSAVKNSTEQSELDFVLGSAGQQITEKKCCKCKVVKLVSEFYRCSDPRNKIPLSSRCKQCLGNKGKRNNHIGGGFKVCSKCKTKKPATKEFFNKQENKIPIDKLVKLTWNGITYCSRSAVSNRTPAVLTTAEMTFSKVNK